MEEALALPDGGRRLDGGTAPARPRLHLAPGEPRVLQGAGARVPQGSPSGPGSDSRAALPLSEA